jgi:hypothetical protein
LLLELLIELLSRRPTARANRARSAGVKPEHRLPSAHLPLGVWSWRTAGVEELLLLVPVIR